MCLSECAKGVGEKFYNSGSKDISQSVHSTLGENRNNDITICILKNSHLPISTNILLKFHQFVEDILNSSINNWI